MDDLESSSYSEPVAWPSTIGHASTWREEPSHYHHRAHHRAGGPGRPPRHSSPSRHKAGQLSPSHKKIKHGRTKPSHNYAKQSHNYAKHSHLGGSSHKGAKLSHPLVEFSHQQPTQQRASSSRERTKHLPRTPPSVKHSSLLQENTELLRPEAWEKTREPRKSKSSTEEKSSTLCSSELCLSDLESNVSPGALPTLNPSGTSESSSEPPLLLAPLPDLNGDTKGPKIDPFLEICEFPLLQMEPFPQQTAGMTGCSLEQAFPDVAENLKMFEQSIIPKWKSFAAEQNHHASASVPKWKETMPKESTFVRMQKGSTPKMETQVEPPSPTEECSFPLLSLLEEVVDYPGLIQVPRSHQPLTHQPPPVQQPPSTLGVPPQQLFLIPFSSQPYQVPQFPPLVSNHPPCATTQSEAPSQSSNLQLPNVPLTPFTPVLVPNPQAPKALKLLKLEDPLTKMKEEGLNLLQLNEVQDRTSNSAQPSRDPLGSSALQQTKSREAAVSRHVPALRQMRPQHSDTPSESSSAGIAVPKQVSLERRKKNRKAVSSHHKNVAGMPTTSEAYSSKVSSEVETTTVDGDFLQERLETVKKSEYVATEKSLPAAKTRRVKDVGDSSNFVATRLEKPEEMKVPAPPSAKLQVDSSIYSAKSLEKPEEVKVQLREEQLDYQERVPSPLKDPAKLQDAVVSHEAKKPAEAAFYPTEEGLDKMAATFTKSKPSSEKKLPDLGFQLPSERSDFPDLFSPLESLEIRRLNLLSLNREEATLGTSSESDRVMDVAITSVKKDNISPPELESKGINYSSPPVEVATPIDADSATVHPTLEIAKTVKENDSLKSTYLKSEVAIRSSTAPLPAPGPLPDPTAQAKTVKEEDSLKSTYTKSEVAIHSPATALPALLPTAQAKPIEPPIPHSPPHEALASPEHLTPTGIRHSSLEDHSSKSSSSESSSSKSSSTPKLPPPTLEDHAPTPNLSPLHHLPTIRSPPQADSTGRKLVGILSPKQSQDEKDVRTTPTSSVAVQVGFDVTPPIDLNFPTEDQGTDELDIPG